MRGGKIPWSANSLLWLGSSVNLTFQFFLIRRVVFSTPKKVRSLGLAVHATMADVEQARTEDNDSSGSEDEVSERAGRQSGEWRMETSVSILVGSY